MSKLKISEFISQSPSIAVILTGLNLQRQLNNELKKFDLSLFSALILVSIFFEKEKSLRPSSLYELFPLSKGNISHLTSSLESMKLIVRFSSADDLRAHEFRLSNKGEKMAIELIKFFNQNEDETDELFSKNDSRKFLEVIEVLKNQIKK